MGSLGQGERKMLVYSYFKPLNKHWTAVSVQEGIGGRVNSIFDGYKLVIVKLQPDLEPNLNELEQT